VKETIFASLPEILEDGKDDLDERRLFWDGGDGGGREGAEAHGDENEGSRLYEEAGYMRMRIPWQRFPIKKDRDV